MEGRGGCFNTCPGVRHADSTKLGQGKRDGGPLERNLDCLLLLSMIERAAMWRRMHGCSQHHTTAFWFVWCSSSTKAKAKEME